MAVQIALRIEDEVLTELDALLPSLSTPWRKMTRSDILRAAVVMGLPALKVQATAVASAMTDASFSRSPVAAPLAPNPLEPQEPAQRAKYEAEAVAVTRDEVDEQLRAGGPATSQHTGPEIAIHDFDTPAKSRSLPPPVQTTPERVILPQSPQPSPAVNAPGVDDRTTNLDHELPPASRPVVANASNVRSRLSKAINSGGLKLMTLADEIGVSRSCLQNFKSGTTMSQEKLRALNAALKGHGI